METDVLLCSRCGSDDVAATENGLCRDCHQAEHGPDEIPLHAGGDVAGYRQNLIDAGRSHLL